MYLKELFKLVFTWWNGRTVGLLWYSKRFGVAVGSDNQERTFYRSQDGERRWFVGVRAAPMSPSWYAWLHKLTDLVPSDKEDTHLHSDIASVDKWSAASLYKQGAVCRKVVESDYKAWTPSR